MQSWQNAVKSKQLFNPQAELTEPHLDVLCEYDVKIPIREFFSVTANIFGQEKRQNRAKEHLL
jgi:hypothetical protein